MKINGEPTRTIRLHCDNPRVVQVIDQRQLPHQLTWMDLNSVDEAAYAIKDMVVRGAPLIGATAALGMYLAALDAVEAEDFRDVLHQAAQTLGQTRPTAVNLHWALTSQLHALREVATAAEAVDRLRQNAEAIIDADEEQCRQIGLHGVKLIEDIHARTGQPVNILTHCNAGWLACVDWDTATSPIYHAHDRGIP
ncbi:S-methyl-5-thioribose-1-phosphate isomerase, partial [filamentous cyanobacterium CCP4]